MNGDGSNQIKIDEKIQIKISLLVVMSRAAILNMVWVKASGSFLSSALLI